MRDSVSPRTSGGRSAARPAVRPQRNRVGPCTTQEIPDPTAGRTPDSGVSRRLFAALCTGVGRPNAATMGPCGSPPSRSRCPIGCARSRAEPASSRCGSTRSAGSRSAPTTSGTSSSARAMARPRSRPRRSAWRGRHATHPCRTFWSWAATTRTSGSRPGRSRARAPSCRAGWPTRRPPFVRSARRSAPCTSGSPSPSARSSGVCPRGSRMPRAAASVCPTNFGRHRPSTCWSCATATRAARTR